MTEPVGFDIDVQAKQSPQNIFTHLYRCIGIQSRYLEWSVAAPHHRQGYTASAFQRKIDVKSRGPYG